MTVTRSFLTDLSLWSWARKTAPAASTFYVGLSTSTSPASTSSIEHFVESEVVGNGYTRQAVTFASDGTFNVTALRHEMPQAQASFTAAGGSIVWRTAFVLYGARTTGTPNVAIASVSGNVITTSVAHGLAANEPVMIHDTGILGMPGGVSAGTLYYAIVLTATTLSLSTSPTGTPTLTITSPGSGPYVLKYAKGGVRSFILQPSSETITSGSTGRVNYDAAALETTYV